jgi:hypothetical protein
MSGSELRLLHDHLEVPARTQMLPDLIAPVADNNRNGRWRQGIGRSEDVVDETAAGQLVQDLGPHRFHPCSLAGCENDDVDAGAHLVDTPNSLVRSMAA